MSSPRSVVSPTRQVLIEAVLRASRESSTTAVLFHSAMAAQMGLGATDQKTLDVLLRLGPLTAGEIAQYTGLTTASVTGLIDRLEKKGFARRVRDTADRRRVIVEANAERLAELDQLFGALRFDDLLDGYSDEQLAAIADFLTRAAQQARQAIEALEQGRAE